MKSSTIATLLSITASALACTRQGSYRVTFFGYPDNGPPVGASTSINCGGRNYVAGGTGTYDDPLTMASASGLFSNCETIYLPYLEKYVRYEDDCEECQSDYDNNGKRHIDIWIGSSTVNGGQEQIDCEGSLTPSPNDNLVIVRDPANNYQVDTAPLYHKGTSNPCRTNHVHPDAKAHTYCS